MAAHRYWRLYIISNNGGNYTEVAELEFRETAGVSQVPSGGTPLWSSRYSSSASYQAANAFDGSNSTRWRASGFQNEWIGYDFGSGNDIEPVEVLLGAFTSTATNNPRDIRVEYSDNGTDWSAYTHLGEQTGWSTSQNRVIALVTSSAPVRVTQIPIQLVEIGNREVRVTQIPIQVVTLPAQPARVTQLPLIVPNTPRPVPFPNVIVPEMPLNETWEWLTAVSIKDNGREQRSALREVPRIRNKITAVTLDDLDRREAYDILWKYQGKTFSWPMYQYGAFLEPASQGSSTLYFDPALTDLRSGEQAALFDPHTGETKYATIDTIAVDGCDVVEPLSFAIGSGWQICPAVSCRMVGPGSLTLGMISGDLSFDIENMGHRDFQRVDGSSLLTAYDGYVVLDRRPLATADNEYSRNVNWIDNGIGVPLPETKWRMNFSSGKRSFNFNRYQDMDYWRAFADFIRGRQKAFIHPTYFDDLPLASSPALGATELISTNIQADEYLSGPLNKYIRIERQNGVIFRRINDRRLVYNANGDPVALTLFLNQNIGSTIGSNNISKISFAPLTRLNSDTITLRHESLDTTLTFDVRTVNE